VRLVDLESVFRLDQKYQNGENFGSEDFNLIPALKWTIILHEIQTQASTVLFFDTDVFFRRPVTQLVAALARQYPIGMQDEAQMRVPPTLCTGFMFWAPQTTSLLKLLVRLSRKNPGVANDQVLFNELLNTEPVIAKKTFSFPTSLFPNGLHSKLFSRQASLQTVTELSPYIFHANFVVGSTAKIKLLKTTGNWLNS
jgi:hypothetical protein